MEITNILHLGHVVGKFFAGAMDVDDLGLDRHHPEFLQVFGVADLCVGQDSQVVELDAIVLTETDQLVDSVAEGSLGLAGEPQNEIAVGLDLVRSKAPR